MYVSYNIICKQYCIILHKQEYEKKVLLVTLYSIYDCLVFRTQCHLTERTEIS